MNEQEQKYWAGEFSDEELDAIADQGLARLREEVEKAWKVLKAAMARGDLDSPKVVAAADVVKRSKS